MKELPRKSRCRLSAESPRATRREHEDVRNRGKTQGLIHNVRNEGVIDVDAVANRPEIDQWLDLKELSNQPAKAVEARSTTHPASKAAPTSKIAYPIILP